MEDLANDLALAQTGDARAYHRFLAAMSKKLASYFRFRVGPTVDVDDLVQQTLLRIHTYRHTYDPAQKAEPWAYTIARNVLCDHFRARAKHRHVDAIDETVCEVGAWDQNEAASMLQQALEKMPKTLKEAFVLVKMNGLMMEEAAERLGISVSAMKVRACRAYKFMESYIGA